MHESLEETIQLEEDTQKGRYLTFSLDDEEYGMEIKNVTEIVGIQSITEVPELPEYIKGIINLRGKIIPVIDVRLRFGKERRDYNDRTCIIVIDVYDLSIGLIVDSVTEVLAIADEDIVPPPQLNNDLGKKYIKAIGKSGNNIKLLIDCEKLFGYEMKNILDEKMQ